MIGKPTNMTGRSWPRAAVVVGRFVLTGSPYQIKPTNG